jgi:hypothetical protein
MAAIAYRWREPSGDMLLPISPILMKALGVKVRPDDPRVERLKQALFEDDPVADAAVAWMHGDPARREAFERVLERGGEPPPELRALFAEVDRVPDWLDRKMVRLGTETLMRVGRGAVYALGGASLMSGYLSCGAVKPLVRTGALTRAARRRLAETGMYIHDLASSKELHRFSPGVKSSVRVRLLHSMIRMRQRSSPDWNLEAWGIPINQRDMIGTHLEFTVAFIGGLTALGYLISRKEREALMHMWRYVGHLMGIRADLLPATFNEGIELAWIFNATEKGPDEDGRTTPGSTRRSWSRRCAARWRSSACSSPAVVR